MEGEIAAVELALRKLEAPAPDGMKLHEVIEAGERMPGIVALWELATVEERREMVILLLEPDGLYYELETKCIVAIKPRPAFLSLLRMLDGGVEFDETKGLIVMKSR